MFYCICLWSNENIALLLNVINGIICRDFNKNYRFCLPICPPSYLHQLIDKFMFSDLHKTVETHFNIFLFIFQSVGPKLYTKTCLYTMTPDRHFVVDTCAHKGFGDVIVCCGGGHIYK